jgi:hypothetical protein
MAKFWGEEVPEFFAEFCLKASKLFPGKPENGPHIYSIPEDEYDKLYSALPVAGNFCSRIVDREHFLIGNFSIAVVRGSSVYRP